MNGLPNHWDKLDPGVIDMIVDARRTREREGPVGLTLQLRENLKDQPASTLSTMFAYLLVHMTYVTPVQVSTDPMLQAARGTMHMIECATWLRELRGQKAVAQEVRRTLDGHSLHFVRETLISAVVQLTYTTIIEHERVLDDEPS